VTAEKAAEFAWAVRDTLDQYLAVAGQYGFTKRKQLLDLLDNYEGRDDLIAWIRENGSEDWSTYLDRVAPSQDASGRP
jgi:hypothetical protein